MIKPETKALKELLRGMGVGHARVRTDTTLQWTSATMLEPDDIAIIDARAEQLAADGYGVSIDRFAGGGYSHAVVTTDQRRAGRVRRVTGPSLPAA